jgi:hypothetical protein
LGTTRKLCFHAAASAQPMAHAFGEVRGACGGLYVVLDVLARHGGKTMFTRQAETQLR